MRPKEFEAFFQSISRQMPISLYAKRLDSEKPSACLLVHESMPVWDALELLEKQGCLSLPDGRILKGKFLLKKPLRTLFFILLTELEACLYRTQEWSGKPLQELNEKNMNDLIRSLVSDKRLFSYQAEYLKPSKFREGLKAASSLRNLIMHVNKKLELETDFETILKRKDQVLKVLKALNQILEVLEKERNNV